jgi:hypothetical protein
MDALLFGMQGLWDATILGCQTLAWVPSCGVDLTQLGLKEWMARAQTVAV